MILNLAIISWVWHQMDRQQQQKYINWTWSKFKCFVKQRHYEEHEKATQRMQENICKSYIEKGTNIKIYKELKKLK